jgi:hypothetical protein
VLHTGSSSSAAGSIQATAHADPAAGPARRRRNNRSTTAVSATLPRVSRAPAAAIGSSASGASTTAAMGG